MTTAELHALGDDIAAHRENLERIAETMDEERRRELQELRYKAARYERAMDALLDLVVAVEGRESGIEWERAVRLLTHEGYLGAEYENQTRAI